MKSLSSFQPLRKQSSLIVGKPIQKQKSQIYQHTQTEAIKLYEHVDIEEESVEVNSIFDKNISLEPLEFNQTDLKKNNSSPLSFNLGEIMDKWGKDGRLTQEVAYYMFHNKIEQ